MSPGVQVPRDVSLACFLRHKNESGTGQQRPPTPPGRGRGPRAGRPHGARASSSAPPAPQPRLQEPPLHKPRAAEARPARRDPARGPGAVGEATRGPAGAVFVSRSPLTVGSWSSAPQAPLGSGIGAVESLGARPDHTGGRTQGRRALTTARRRARPRRWPRRPGSPGPVLAPEALAPPVCPALSFSHVPSPPPPRPAELAVAPAGPGPPHKSWLLPSPLPAPRPPSRTVLVPTGFWSPPGSGPRRALGPAGLRAAGLWWGVSQVHGPPRRHPCFSVCCVRPSHLGDRPHFRLRRG